MCPWKLRGSYLSQRPPVKGFESTEKTALGQSPDEYGPMQRRLAERCCQVRGHRHRLCWRSDGQGGGPTSAPGRFCPKRQAMIL
jgi:hypothetical protein